MGDTSVLSVLRCRAPSDLGQPDDNSTLCWPPASVCVWCYCCCAGALLQTQAFCNKYFGGRNAVIFSPQQLRELCSELHLDLEPRYADLSGGGWPHYACSTGWAVHAHGGGCMLLLRSW